MELKDKILEIENSLKFPVDYIPHNFLCGIKFDSQNDCYQLFRIIKNYPEKEIDCLHELCHAKLRESVHPVFCEVPLDFTDKDLSPIRVAQDWFADEMVFNLFPEHQQRRIHSRFKTIRKELANPIYGKDSDNLLRWALIIAQAKRYLKPPSLTLSDPLLRLVNNFLKVDPGIASVEILRNLVNSLNETLNFDFRVDIINDTWNRKIL